MLMDFPRHILLLPLQLRVHLLLLLVEVVPSCLLDDHHYVDLVVVVDGDDGTVVDVVVGDMDRSCNVVSMG